MLFAIHPSAFEIREQAARGKRALWFPSPLSWLFCFGKNFDGRFDWIRWSWSGSDQGGIFDLGYSVLTEGRIGEIIGIKFYCLEEQLMQSNELLAQQDDEHNLPALAVLEHIIQWTEIHAPLFPESTRLTVSARQFLEAEQILIPSSEWMKALPRCV